MVSAVNSKFIDSLSIRDAQGVALFEFLNFEFSFLQESLGRSLILNFEFINFGFSFLQESLGRSLTLNFEFINFELPRA